MRTYELTFVLDPRLPDEGTQALCDEYKQMIEAVGGRVEHRDDWGKRQLAYPIGKLEEGRYFLWHLSSDSDSGSPTREVEHRMRQKEEVLRFLTVRTEKLDFDATAASAESAEVAEQAKETGKEPVREEAPEQETPAAAAAAPGTAEPATPETPALVESPAPQTAPATADETAPPAAASEADGGAVEAAEAEEEAAVDDAPNAGDAASGEGETPSEEETR